jgi:hypothetical protein
MNLVLIQVHNAKDALPGLIRLKWVLVLVHNAKDVKQGHIPQKWVLLRPISVSSVQLATASQTQDLPNVLQTKS